MLTVYPAIFYHERDGGYSVVFPDLHHLSTCGDTLPETIGMAVDCLAGYLYDAKNAAKKCRRRRRSREWIRIVRMIPMMLTQTMMSLSI